MREHFPSTGRGARLADAFASWRAAVITFQLLARRRLKREIVKMCWHVLTRFPKARGQRIGPPVAGGCVSIRLKFFWFSLFTKRTVPAGAVTRRVPRLRREIVKMCWHVLTRFSQARGQRTGVEAVHSECRKAPPARRTRSRHGGRPLIISKQSRPA